MLKSHINQCISSINKMFLNKISEKFREYSYFIWLILLVIIAITVTNFYDNNKKNQVIFLKKTLDNIYLKKTIKKIAFELEPRFKEIDYIVKQGDTYESIIKKLNISNKEKKILLETIKKHKKLKILRLNQKILFKIDERNYSKIIEFKIEIDNKNEILF